MNLKMTSAGVTIVAGAAATGAVALWLLFAQLTKTPEVKIPKVDSDFGFVVDGEPSAEPEAPAGDDVYCMLAGGEKIYGRFVSVRRGGVQEIIGLKIRAYDAKARFAFSAYTRIVTPGIAAEYKEWRESTGANVEMGVADITDFAPLKGGVIPDRKLAARALQAFLYSGALVPAALTHGGQVVLSGNQGNLHEMRLQLAASYRIPVQGAPCKQVQSLT
ncbi:MAG: hypothetical protein EBQ96_05995 [Proteobacteria bacterium]|nr:hypothetical protein [Pseudomonadota bacterium]